MHAPRRIEATVFATLPQAMRHMGPATQWARQARPGQDIHSFLEGPAFDRDGNLWLVDVAFGRIFCVDAAGRWDLACRYEGEPHGLALMNNGAFAVTDHCNGLLRLNPATGKMTPLCPAPIGEGFRGLNDIARGPNGDLWFTDPGRSSLSDPSGRLFHRAVDGKSPRRVLANIPYPNGVAVAPDGTYVYVAATRANAVWRLVAALPECDAPMVGLFVQLSGGLGPDGLAVSPSGHLAIAQAQAGRVYVVDPNGDMSARIDTPGGMWTTAVVFDELGEILYITEAQTGSVYAASMDDII